jgi:hypothetical protein
VNNDPRPRRHRKESVKIGNAKGFGRREVQPPAGVVQGAGADPADAAVDGVEHRKQQVPPRPGRPFILEMVVFRLPGLEGAKDAIDSGALFPVWRMTGDMKVQRQSPRLARAGRHGVF